MSEKKIINIGSAELAGDGETLRSAFEKINHNFDDLYSGTGTTLGTDTTPSLGGNLDLNSNDITGIGNINVTGDITASGSLTASVDYTNLTNTPTTLAGYGITDTIVLSDTSIEAQPIRQYYADQAAFPSAADWHGAIAHSHADGSLYFAHGGVWNKIANDADTFDGTYSSLTGTPTTLAGYGITDAFDGTYSSLTGTPTTLAGYGITDALTSSTSAADITGYGVFTGTQETFATLTGATGTVTHDCDTGHIFYHTGAVADWTVNFTNLNLTAEHATTLSIVVTQGNTAYIPNAVEIGGVAQTIIWQGNSTPSGTDNGTDVIAFNVLNDGGTYIVLGQLVSFGGV